MEPEFFIRTKPVRALVALSDKNREWYAHLLAKEIDCTYAHLIKLLDTMAEANIVIFEREGRIKKVKLTEFGEELAHDFETVLRRLEKIK
ncbi:MAG: hypothetical protein J7K68_04705 [Candidatus Diapherotrites archaeon]|nr:hypothetical protein [Candidatus Diapherotrites archaeon]